MINLANGTFNARDVNASMLQEHEETAHKFRDLLRQYIGGDLVDIRLSYLPSFQGNALYFTPMGSITFDGEVLFDRPLCDCINAVCYVVGRLQGEIQHGDA